MTTTAPDTPDVDAEVDGAGPSDPGQSKFAPAKLLRTYGALLAIAVLALTFLVIAVMFDGLWAILADRARGLRQGHRRLLNRIAGGFLIAAATGLALARRA